jgi:hypothetical protein
MQQSTNVGTEIRIPRIKRSRTPREKSSTHVGFVRDISDQKRIAGLYVEST